MIITGIYLIEGLNNEIYIGSAGGHSGVKKRWSWHLSKLRVGKHPYPELQDAFISNPSNVKFALLEPCSDDELLDREEWWIKYYGEIDTVKIINKNTDHVTRPSRNKDTSNKSKAQQGVKNGHCKTDLKTILYIKKLIKENVPNNKIAKLTGKSPSYISSIKTNDKWSSVNIDDVDDNWEA